MTRRVAIAATGLPLLAAALGGGATTPASASDTPALSALRPFEGVEAVPMPEAAPLRPGPVPMPLVRPRGLPVPMPLVDPGRSVGQLVPEDPRGGR